MDPDVDLRLPSNRRELRDRPWVVLAVIAAGGVLGAESRYGLQRAFPHRAGAFDWATFGINVSGCLLIGVLMVLVTEVFTAQRLIRPFFGVGILGGYTTFSTYVVDIQKETPRTALAYLAVTLVAALCAVWAGDAAAGWAVRALRGGDRG